MRQAVRFVVGLFLALLLAGAVLTAVAGTFTLVKEAFGSGGDASELEAGMRHYTDRIDVSPDGTVRVVRASRPVLQFVATVVGVWIVAAGALVALRRLLVGLR